MRPGDFPCPPPPRTTARHEAGENSGQGAVIGLCIEQRKLLYEQQSGRVLASPHHSPPRSGAVTSPPGRGHVGRATGPPPATGGRPRSQLISTYRADWEPAATSRRRALGVFWRCPAVCKHPSVRIGVSLLRKATGRGPSGTEGPIADFTQRFGFPHEPWPWAIGRGGSYHGCLGQRSRQFVSCSRPKAAPVCALQLAPEIARGVHSRQRPQSDSDSKGRGTRARFTFWSFGPVPLLPLCTSSPGLVGISTDPISSRQRRHTKNTQTPSAGLYPPS